jgi:hypothetical protein
MAREPDEAPGTGPGRAGRRGSAPRSPAVADRTTMWAVALEGEEFAPVFLDVCDVVTALRLTHTTHPGRTVRVVAVPRRSSPN